MTQDPRSAFIAEVSSILGPNVSPEQKESVAKILLQRARDAVRHETLLSDQHLRRSWHTFLLRLTMGYSSIVLLIAVLVITVFIIFNHASFPEYVVKSALAALVVDILGQILSVWQLVFKASDSLTPIPIPESEITV